MIVLRFQHSHSLVVLILLNKNNTTNFPKKSDANVFINSFIYSLKLVH